MRRKGRGSVTGFQLQTRGMFRMSVEAGESQREAETEEVGALLRGGLLGYTDGKWQRSHCSCKSHLEA